MVLYAHIAYIRSAIRTSMLLGENSDSVTTGTDHVCYWARLSSLTSKRQVTFLAITLVSIARKDATFQLSNRSAAPS